MAYLIDLETGDGFPLLAHHTVGSLSAKVDTLVDKPYVSKLHAAFEWTGCEWHIRDLSRNGTWVNQAPLSKSTSYRLKSGDRIQFADASSPGYQVQDLSAPCDQLIPVAGFNKPNRFKPRLLEAYNLLPDEEHPEYALYWDDSLGHWCLESIQQEEAPPQLLRHNAFVTIQNMQWQLFRAGTCQQTEVDHFTPLQLPDFKLVFDVSADEETTQLVLEHQQLRVDLMARSHHYLLLHLARLRREDKQRGVDSSNQGWVYSDRVARDLGIDQAHLNILIYRARKQLTEALPGVPGRHLLVERKGGRIRMGCHQYVILKGGATEQPDSQGQKTFAVTAL